jgi:hypothetical protein
MWCNFLKKTYTLLLEGKWEQMTYVMCEIFVTLAEELNICKSKLLLSKGPGYY